MAKTRRYISLYQQNNYTEAYKNIKNVVNPGNINHKLDYLLFWSHKMYSGLILHKMGQSMDGINDIKSCIENMEQFGSSRYLADAWRALGEIFSDINKYDDAYSAIKS